MIDAARFRHGAIHVQPPCARRSLSHWANPDSGTTIVGLRAAAVAMRDQWQRGQLPSDAEPAIAMRQMRSSLAGRRPRLLVVRCA
jgi:hypothetical protein